MLRLERFTKLSLSSNNDAYKYDLFTLITSECTSNADCSGASDTCKVNICYCGSDDKCTGGADTCTDGQCKCGVHDECSFPETCFRGKCLGKQMTIFVLSMCIHNRT